MDSIIRQLVRYAQNIGPWGEFTELDFCALRIVVILTRRCHNLCLVIVVNVAVKYVQFVITFMSDLQDGA